MATTQSTPILNEDYLAIRMETAKRLLSFVESVKVSPQGKGAELLFEIRKLEDELRHLKRAKRYGLVWEDKPEEFEETAKNALPVLEEDRDLSVSDGSNDLQNLIIEGDNYHSLAALSFTHSGKIDVIYIDPPYNTGNKDFVYNDQYIDREDGFRHSKWLSFMEKRLRLARDLLKDTGIIFLSIDDNEQGQLRLLCNEIFGEINFLGQLIIETATDNNPRQISTEHEYMLCYCKNKELQGYWTGISRGAILIQESYSKLKELHGAGNVELMQAGLRKWISANKELLDKVSHYKYVDTKGVYYLGDISNTKPGGYVYEVMHPVTQKPCKTPPNGFRFPEETMQELLSNGDISFGPDESTIPTTKRRLEKVSDKLRSIYYEDGRVATKDLLNIFGEKKFNNPKSINLLGHVFSFIPNSQEAIFLDFFAGSGTTGHAILSLNREDGGNRRFVLCSNRENTSENPDKNLCRDVCYERVKRVATGYKNLKGEDVAGLGGNLRYFRTGFVKYTKSMDDLRHAFVERCSDLLRIREDCYDPLQVHSSGDALRVFSSKKKSLAILFDPTKLSELESFLRNSKGPVSAYIFTISPEPFAEELANFSNRLTIEPIPDTILSAYKKIFRI